MTSKFSIDNRELLQRISSGEAVVGIDFGNLIVRELAAFRLAAMDSEPVAKQVACWSCRNKVEISAIGDCDGYCPNCNSPIDLDEEPYTAPQSAQSAPVVPDEMDRIGAFDMFDSLPDGDVVDCVQYTWNACRAAMLNGGKP